MRRERDSLGEMDIPDEAYYGIQTTRVTANYDVTGRTYDDYPEVLRAEAEVKKACAITNAEIGALAPEKAKAIAQACDEMAAGKFRGHFPVRAFRSQGTGVNMNVNEVLANRANEILTGRRGYSEVHPNTHVNMCQSSNDTFPTVEAIVFRRSVVGLARAVRGLEARLAEKASETRDVVRLGRTGLQDAVPMTWGQVFGGWHSMMRREREALEALEPVFRRVTLGATVLGTGMGQLPGYAERVYGNLSRIVGFEVRPPVMEGEAVPDSAVFDAMRNTDHTMALTAVLNSVASAAGRIARDLILLASGPAAGLGEITLPRVEGLPAFPWGDSPCWIPELVADVMHQAAGAGQMAVFSANEGQQDHGSVNSGGFIPALDAIRLLLRALPLLSEKCVAGIRVNEEVCRQNACMSTSLATMVASLYGYPTGVKIAKRALADGVSCREAALREKALPPEAADELFDVRRLTDRSAMVELFRKYGSLRSVR